VRVDADGLTGRTLSVLLLQQRGARGAAYPRQGRGDEVKFWLAPIALAANYSFNGRELSEIERLVEQHRLGLLEAWNEHLG
jgi:uncharacterized protein DUF4160